MAKLFTKMINSEIKRICSLRHKKYRYNHHQFFIEGKRLIQAALEYEHKLSAIYITNRFIQDNPEWAESSITNNVKVIHLSSKIMEKISNTKTPSGIAAVCILPKVSKPDNNVNRWLYLESISDPGNLGSLFRSAAWFGFNHVGLSKDCVDPYNPKVIRSGMGAHFPLTIHTEFELSGFLKSHKLFGADQNGTELTKVTLPNKFILALGNEAHGLSNDIRQQMSKAISIKRWGFGESLNVAIAGSIIMYQLKN